MPQQWSWKRFFKTSFLYLIFVASIIGGFVTLYISHTFLTVKNIDVVERTKKIPIIGIESLKGQNMLLFQPDEAEKMLRSQNPTIKTIHIDKKYPNTLDISITRYTPYALMQADEGYFVLSQDGRILEKRRDRLSKLPLITYYQKPNYLLTQSGQSMNFDDVLLALHFVEKAHSVGIAVETVDIASFHMIRLVSKEKTVLVSADKDKQLQDYQFETVVRELRIQGQDFKTLDLRFDKPVYEPIKK